MFKSLFSIILQVFERLWKNVISSPVYRSLGWRLSVFAPFSSKPRAILSGCWLNLAMSTGTFNRALTTLALDSIQCLTWVVIHLCIIPSSTVYYVGYWVSLAYLFGYFVSKVNLHELYMYLWRRKNVLEIWKICVYNLSYSTHTNSERLRGKVMTSTGSQLRTCSSSKPEWSRIFRCICFHESQTRRPSLKQNKLMTYPFM